MRSNRLLVVAVAIGAAECCGCCSYGPVCAGSGSGGKYAKSPSSASDSASESEPALCCRLCCCSCCIARWCARTGSAAEDGPSAGTQVTSPGPVELVCEGIDDSALVVGRFDGIVRPSRGSRQVFASKFRPRLPRHGCSGTAAMLPSLPPAPIVRAQRGRGSNSGHACCHWLLGHTASPPLLNN